MNIIFVKWGTKYSCDHVIKLYESLYKHGPNHDYFCYTDDPEGLEGYKIKIIPIPVPPLLKKWWNKLRMFSKTFPLKGECLYFDLDVKINSDPFYIKDKINWDKLTLVDCPWKRDGYNIGNPLTNYEVTINSSVMAWKANRHSENIHDIWNHFNKSGYKDYFLRKYIGIDRYIVHEDFEYNVFPTDFIQSYKYEKDKKAPVTTFEEIDFEGTNTISQS